MHHFTWGSIAPTQQVNVPFPVSLTAQDSSGNIVTNFTGAVALSGRQGGGGAIFSANFDSGSDGFTYGADPDASTNLWHRTAHRFVSPTNCQYYGLEGGWNYETGTRNAGNLLSPPISLVGASTPLTLSFKYLLQTESVTNYDTAAVDISTNAGATWVTLVSRVGTNALVNTVSFTNWVGDLSAYAGNNILLRFNFDTVDAVGNTYEGWYLDDVAITTATTSVAVLPTNSGPFVNGVWTGNVTVLESADSLFLRADDGSGHTGDSNPFNVQMSPQPAITWQYNAGAGTLELAWSGSGFRLQAQTNSLDTGISANWFDYPGGTNSPVTIAPDPANPAVFYRLVSP